MTDKATSQIVSFKPLGWFGRGELADKLGVTTRTVERKVKAGLIEKRKSAQGKIYRVKTPSDIAPSEDVAFQAQPTQPTQVNQEATSALVTPLIARLEEQAVTIALQGQRLKSLEERNIQLEEELTSLRAKMKGTQAIPLPADPTGERRRTRRLVSSSKPSPETMARLMRRRK